MIAVLNKKPERRRVLAGQRLHTTGHSEQIALPISRVKFHLRATVLHENAPATLYFENYKVRRTPMNLRH